ncbi:PAS domain S-box protein [Halorhabdus sp. CBA1104]|uniref:PAS domain-containing sensor histidine kinase n=1 Tax=Halorhabdus sp. CBA1104 TaxID=1380432 RepID=UPI0012B3FB22|nr:PAS domain S-box protein [Halorhabdus sp. CBA1104]QGN07747.1 PAS domain S-box protein [Halorhabdus sp. CBA1104]
MDSDALAQQAFEEAATIMVILGADGTIRRINDRGCRILGYDRSTLDGADWFETVVPADSDIGLADVLRALRDEDGFDVHENTIRTDDGEIRCIKWHVTGVRDDTGAITSLLVSGSDVTERVETERRLRRYEQAVESSTNLLAAVDCGYTYILTNSRYRTFHGIEGSGEGVTVPDVLGTDGFEDVKTHIDSALSGESVEYEIARTGPDGDEHVFAVRYFPLEAADGSVQGAMASLRDVTQRRERERRRKETLDTFEALFHGINDAIFVHDLDGRFLAVNNTAHTRLGYEESELLGMTPWDIEANDAGAKIDDRIETIQEAGTLTFETAHLTTTGTEIPVEITSSLVTYFGEDAILSVARDISERKERERKLRREIDRLEEFAGVISHDLRNPLNVAQGRITLLDEECSTEHTHIEPIETALDRMEAIIEDTLTLARQGQTVGETELVAIANVVEQCWDGVLTEAATLERDADFTVRADRDRLQHVFENLLRNAIEHGQTRSDSRADRDGHPDDALTVRIGRLEDTGFYVEDDGPGIPVADRERVFEPGVTTQEHGTGFGLSIVRQIADAHGWTVSVTDSSSGGARFVFEGVEIVE